MARHSSNKQHPTHTGSAITLEAPTGAGSGNGWTFSNATQPNVLVWNTDDSSKTLTLKANGPEVGGIALTDKTVVVPAMDEDGVPGYVLLKLPKAYFGETAQIDVDDNTGVTLAVFG